MDNNNNSSGEDGGNKKRKSDDISDNNNHSDSITSAATHLHSLLIAKEKELKGKEADFDKRVKLYESKHPSIGTDADILQLNVGGSTLSVRRSTLTQFPDTLLAATFSGRWDESMEKDRDGNIFIDQDPDNFLLLVNYLRLRMNNQSRKVPEKNLPKPTYSLCYMLEYY